MKKTLNKLLSAVLALTLVMSFGTTAFAATFTDVSDGSDGKKAHWGYEFIEKAVANDLVKGMGNGKYAPDNNVTNAEWSQMIVNLFDPARNALGGGEGTNWYDGALDFTDRGGFLKGTVMGNKGVKNGKYDATVANTDINRYDMAQVIYNIAKDRLFGFDLTVNTNGIGNYIGDYRDVSATTYRDAVDYCYAAGFITGRDTVGTFAGSATMTRAEAATVLCRMLDAKNGNWTVPERETGNTETPAPSITAVKDMITVKESTRANYDYEITVTNTYTAGKLSNGKDINSTNIAAMLAELEKVFPTGTSWGNPSEGDTYRYASSMFGAGGDCNAWAYMAFDVLFGTGAKAKSSTDIYSAKPGDLIEFKDANGTTKHWAMVMTNDGTKITTCDGNLSAKVRWGTNRPIEYTLTGYPSVTVYSAY